MRHAAAHGAAGRDASSPSSGTDGPAGSGEAALPPPQLGLQQQMQAVVSGLDAPLTAALLLELLKAVVGLQLRVGQLERQLAPDAVAQQPAGHEVSGC